jgi:hypothetical protein
MCVDVELCSFGNPEHKIRKSGIGNQLPVRHERSNPGKSLELVFHHAASLLFEVFACFLGKPGDGVLSL